MCCQCAFVAESAAKESKHGCGYALWTAHAVSLGAGAQLADFMGPRRRLARARAGAESLGCGRLAPLLLPARITRRMASLR
jgi:hypothetical protein